MNLREIETLRTKEELVRYFEERGKNITEEEIEALNKSYEEAKEATGTLTMQQLDDVAGGVHIFIHTNGLATHHEVRDDHKPLISMTDERYKLGHPLHTVKDMTSD